MHNKLTLIVIIFILLSLMIIPSAAFDSNDYGGGDSGDSGGSWDSGGSDSDDSWSGGWSSGDSGGGGGSSGGGISATFVIIIIIIYVIYIVMKNSGKYKSNNSGGHGRYGGPSATGAPAVRPSSGQGLHIRLPDRTTEISGIIKERDPNFSASDFITFAKRLYIDIQTAWYKRDLPSVRAFLHDNLYDATTRQLQAKIDQGVVYHYESMVVNTTYLTSYSRDGQFEYLTLYLNARMIDWQEDEKTGRILRGDKTTRWDLRYKMTFMRSNGVQTKEAVSKATSHNCPNCAAPLEFTSSAQCAYCGSFVTTGMYSWVLSDFGTIRDDTRDDGIQIGG